MKCKLLTLAAAAVLVPSSALANVFFDSFDTSASSANWLETRVATGIHVVDYSFDYSTAGIAEAPNSAAGSTATRGLYVNANKPATGGGTINGINLTAAFNGSPVVFTGDYTYSFDMWVNVGTDTAASTELVLFGVNTDGAGTNTRTGATQTGADGVWYHLSGDGGFGNTSATANSRDYVAYNGNTVFGRLDNTEDPFASLFPNSTPVGSLRNQWVRVVIRETGGNVVLSLNGTDVFTGSAGAFAEGSFFLGYQDPFSGSVPTDPANYFAVFDNVEAVPEPATMAVAGLALAALAARKRKKA